MDDAAPADSASRRIGDRSYLLTRLSRLVRWSDTQWHPAGGGRLLLLAAGAVITLLIPVDDPTFRGLGVLVSVTVGMTALLAGSFLMPWTRLPRAATLAFPMSVWLALAVLGIGVDGLGADFTGMITLCFAYIGMTQTARTGVVAAVPAVLAYIAANGGWSTTVAARLPIALAVWLILTVVLSGLIERESVLTEKLRSAAHTDVLTGLGNRRDLEFRLLSVRPGDTVVMCDLDHFKALNDTQGHAAGDLLLAEFGELLRTSLRDNDYAARYGGEEFVLLLRNTDLEQGYAALRRLRVRWLLRASLTFSSGLAPCHDAGSTRQTLEAADRALYAAKAAGRNRDLHEYVADTDPRFIPTAGPAERQPMARRESASTV
jgi:diguanylate cyclase (GGDEF)-like protein